jgi:hypothetical protein
MEAFIEKIRRHKVVKDGGRATDHWNTEQLMEPGIGLAVANGGKVWEAAV